MVIWISQFKGIGKISGEGGSSSNDLDFSDGDPRVLAFDVDILGVVIVDNVAWGFEGIDFLDVSGNGGRVLVKKGF